MPFEVCRGTRPLEFHRRPTFSCSIETMTLAKCWGSPFKLSRAALAAGVPALAIYVGRFFHGLALRTAVLLSVTYIATAIGMRAFLVFRHLVAPWFQQIIVSA